MQAVTTIEAKVRALAKAGHSVGTIARTYQIPAAEVEAICAVPVAPPVPTTPPPPAVKRVEHTTLARRPLMETVNGNRWMYREMLANLDAPWPELVTEIRVGNGRIIFEYD